MRCISTDIPGGVGLDSARADAGTVGEFESLREAARSTLADEFDVSTAAVSKSMRRSEKKLLRSVVAALERLG